MPQAKSPTAGSPDSLILSAYKVSKVLVLTSKLHSVHAGPYSKPHEHH